MWWQSAMRSMLFGEFTNTLRRLDHTSSSTRMIAILADLLSRHVGIRGQTGGLPAPRTSGP